MANFIKIATIIILFSVSKSCKNQKSAAETEETKNMAQKEKQMLADGFQEGKLIANNADGCPVIIKTDGETLDPINMDKFNVDTGSKIWVKYRSLRMKNRCNDGRPVEIEAMEKRVEK